MTFPDLNSGEQREEYSAGSGRDCFLFAEIVSGIFETAGFNSPHRISPRPNTDSHRKCKYFSGNLGLSTISCETSPSAKEARSGIETWRKRRHFVSVDGQRETFGGVRGGETPAT